jgi:hypothetical protein
MAAGLGYKEFTTGDVLTAADANGYLASQVVMVFADAAARTSAITSPQEGMVSYLKDTNATEYYSGSAWVAIGTAPDGNGLKLISATACSAVGSQAITAFSSTYENYRIVIAGDGTADGTLLFKLRSGATDSSTSYYAYTNRYFSTNSTQTYANNNGGDYEIGQCFAAASSVTDVLRPFEAKRTGLLTTYSVFNTSVPRSVNGITQGIHDQQTSYDGFNITLTSGTFTGTIYVYGYQKA